MNKNPSKLFKLMRFIDDGWVKKKKKSALFGVLKAAFHSVTYESE